jgi:hypothetical protein
VQALQEGKESSSLRLGLKPGIFLAYPLIKNDFFQFIYFLSFSLY